MEIGFDGGTGPVVYVISAEEFREWQLTRERLKKREEEINRLRDRARNLESDGWDACNLQTWKETAEAQRELYHTVIDENAELKRKIENQRVQLGALQRQVDHLGGETAQTLRAEIDRLRDVENEAREWNRRYVGLAKGIRAALREAERDFCE